MNYFDQFEKFLNFYYLHEVDSIAISQFLITKRKSLFVDFMRLKEQNYEIAKNYDCKIVSIGQNCLPQTISVRTGLKLPGWLRKEKQMFFDVAQTNIKSANKILSNYSPNLTLCDSYYNDNVHFYSKEFKFLWTHVRVNPNLDFSTNINQYNSLLHERLARNINSLRKGNCLCLICLYYDTQDTPDDLRELERVVKTYNETNKIFVIDYWGRGGGNFKGINYYKCRLPFSSFVWHKRQHYFRPEGFEFYRSISQQVLSFITSVFPQKEDNLDPFSYTENCVAYKDFLISMLKENFKVIYDDRLNVIEDLIKLKKLNI